MPTWILKKEIMISAAHYLPGHGGKCANLHGHNWKITIECAAEELNTQGIVIDFSLIKKAITKVFDHTYLNNYINNPTAENLASKICTIIRTEFDVEVVSIEVEETPGSVICYIP